MNSYLIGVALFVVVPWLLYIYVMLVQHLGSRAPRLLVSLKDVLVKIAPLALGFYNATVGTVLFLSLPREVSFCARLHRHTEEGGWRGNLAAVICRYLLDPFDPNGHCW